MPPKIKREMISISPAFIDLMCDMYNAWVAKNAELIRMAAEGDTSLEAYLREAHYLRPIVRRQSPSPREGFDYEITRLRGLPYTSFDVVEGPMPGTTEGRIRWMVGITKPVTATYYNRRRFDHQTQQFTGPVAGYLGCYNVCIPETMAIDPALKNIHMVPRRNVRSRCRHYHHGITVPWDDDGQVTRHPFSYPTNNCWGDYSSTLNSLITIPDFPELFRQLYRHLSTYGDRPPFTRLDFDTTTPEA